MNKLNDRIEMRFQKSFIAEASELLNEELFKRLWNWLVAVVSFKVVLDDWALPVNDNTSSIKLLKLCI